MMMVQLRHNVLSHLAALSTAFAWPLCFLYVSFLDLVFIVHMERVERVCVFIEMVSLDQCTCARSISKWSVVAGAVVCPKADFVVMKLN